MTRLQYNVCYSYLDGVLSDTATTAIPILNAFKEGGLAGTNIPTVTSPDILVLICEEEVIHVTSYVSGATSIATVLRGQEDTTAVEHPTGARIFNGPTKLDIDPLDADLAAIAALTSAANQLPYATGSETWAMTTLTAFIRTLLDDADASAALTTLGVSTFIKTLLDDSSAATARTTLGAQASDADLTAIAALTSAANQLPYATGTSTWAMTTLTGFARTLLDDPDAATALATIGAQPSDSDLTAIAALTTTAYGRAFLALADAAAARAVILSEQTTITDPTGGGTIDAEARTAINAIIDALQANDIVA